MALEAPCMSMFETELFFMMLTIDLEVLRGLRGHEEGSDTCRAGPLPVKSRSDCLRWWYGGCWNVGDCHPS